MTTTEALFAAVAAAQMDNDTEPPTMVTVPEAEYRVLLAKAHAFDARMAAISAANAVTVALAEMLNAGSESRAAGVSGHHWGVERPPNGTTLLLAHAKEREALAEVDRRRREYARAAVVSDGLELVAKAGGAK